MTSPETSTYHRRGFGDKAPAAGRFSKKLRVFVRNFLEKKAILKPTGAARYKKRGGTKLFYCD